SGSRSALELARRRAGFLARGEGDGTRVRLLVARSGAPERTRSSCAMIDILIVLGPPRSFTTVVSAMLGQHPELYGLPELHLLSAETMAEWSQQCTQATFNMDHGLLRVVAQVYFGEQTAMSVKRAAGWLDRRSHFTTALLLEELADRVRPRRL